MKDVFPGYYRPSDEEFAELWKTCTFTCDTNALLALYEYSTETVEDFLSILEHIQSRLWLPHQVATEYQHLRYGKVYAQSKGYAAASKAITDGVSKIEKALNNLNDNYRFLQVETILEKLNQLSAELEEDLSRQGREHPDWANDDPVRESLDQFLSAKIGPAFSDNKLDEIYRIGETRYKHFRPPGFEDFTDKNKNFPAYYADLVIWFQIIEYAKQNKKPIILGCVDISS